MPIPFLTPGMAESVRRIFAPGNRAHTFTWTPVTLGARTGYGQVPITPGTPIPGEEGRFLSKTQLQRLADGRILATETPTTDDSLLVPYDHPIKVEDLVSNVQDRDLRVLFVGPARVVSIIPGAGLGYTTKKRIVLEGPSEERAD